MQKLAGIWIDHKRAYLIENREGEETIAIVPGMIEDRHYSTGDQHKAFPTGRRIANRRLEETKRYFKYLAKDIADSKAVFICGPGQMKTQFARYLAKLPANHHLAIELDTTSSRLTLNQIRKKLGPHIVALQVAS